MSRNRPYDLFLTTPEFKSRLAEADTFAQENGLDLWTTRVAWIALAEGVPVCKRYVSRNSRTQSAGAREAYQTLQQHNWIIEEHQVLNYHDDMDETWAREPLTWFMDMVKDCSPENRAV